MPEKRHHWQMNLQALNHTLVFSGPLGLQDMASALTDESQSGRHAENFNQDILTYNLAMMRDIHDVASAVLSTGGILGTNGSFFQPDISTVPLDPDLQQRIAERYIVNERGIKLLKDYDFDITQYNLTLAQNAVLVAANLQDALVGELYPAGSINIDFVDRRGKGKIEHVIKPLQKILQEEFKRRKEEYRERGINVTQRITIPNVLEHSMYDVLLANNRTSRRRRTT